MMLDMCGSSGGPSGRELIIDSFAGGGGASTGIRMALGRDPDAALNHNPVALAIHRANHPGSVHYCQDIYSVEPNHVTRGRPVGLLWASPDCTHFSKAKGAAPKRDAKIRDLAWAVVKWAKQARPRVIILENVEEFVTWGPLDEKGEVIKARQGETFKQWLRELRRLGYKVEHRELRACDYGAPTIRKRFFLIARRDGRPIVWPKPTHGPGRPQPYRTAADIIDWSLPCPSIFERKRPLAENTLRRIAEGIRRYVIEAAEPFIVPIEHYNGRVRVQPVSEPLRTVTAGTKGGQFALAVPTLVTNTTGHAPSGAADPLATVTTGGNQMLAAATMIQTGYGERPGQSPRALDLGKPLGTVVAGGTARSVPAMVMPGERVFDPDKAARYAPLLSAINSMTLAREAVAHFATGGDVFRPFRRGLVPGVGDEDSEPVLLQEGAFVVRKAAVAAYGPLLSAIEAGRVPAFASGGFVLPDWLRRIQEARAAQSAAAPAPSVATPATPAPPAAPTPLAVALAAPAAFRGMTTSLAAPAGMTPGGAAAVSRLDGLRQTGALRFASGGNLDETLADIATERQRTKEDYDAAVADAKASHDDDLADLLAKEQKDLDDIAKTLADALAELQTAWEEAQAAYATAMDAAQTDHDDAVAAAQGDYTDAVNDAKKEYEDKKQDLQDAVDDAQKDYDAWKKKGEDEHPGYIKTTAAKSMNSLVPGGGQKGTKTVYSKDYSGEAQAALKEYEEEGKTVKAALQEAKAALADLGGFAVPADATQAFSDAKAQAESDFAATTTEAETTLGDAQNTFTTGTADAKTTAATDTATTQDQAASDKADLDQQLADTLDDLKKDFDRAMEDLDTQEARARADADEEKGYSISGFSQWLSQGGPVAALARIRKFAAGGWAALASKLPHFADGGTVPLVPGAVAGQDSVLSALTPGEGIVRARAMAEILSEKALDALNALDLDGFLGALPHYADGGLVPGGAATVAAAARLEPAAATDGGGYTATLNLAVGGKSFETRATRSTADALARELRRLGANVR